MGIFWKRHSSKLKQTTIPQEMEVDDDGNIVPVNSKQLEIPTGGNGGHYKDGRYEY